MREHPASGRSAVAPPSPRELEAIATDVASYAAGLVRGATKKATAVSTKSSPTDLVTNLDLEVEHAIRELLTRRTPGASIVGEEQDTVTGNTSIGWVVDPIDGTINLVYDLPFVGVSLAATMEGKVVAGAVVDVIADELYSAAAGCGARLNGSTILPSAEENLAQALVTTGFAYSAEDRATEAEYVRRVLPAARDIRCFGSAALHLCWVACGRVDAFYQRNLKPWDHAAGGLIAAESGATVQLPTPDNGELLLAASPLVYEPLHQLIR